MPTEESLIPPHGGYRKLKSFQVAQLIYDVTVRFCERYVDHRSRTRDQMVQAARSGVQNIAEGSQASGTSKKSELKLTNVARASLRSCGSTTKIFCGSGICPGGHRITRRWCGSRRGAAPRSRRSGPGWRKNTDEHGRTRTGTDRVDPGIRPCRSVKVRVRP